MTYVNNTGLYEYEVLITALRLWPHIQNLDGTTSTSWKKKQTQSFLYDYDLKHQLGYNWVKEQDMWIIMHDLGKSETNSYEELDLYSGMQSCET